MSITKTLEVAQPSVKSDDVQQEGPHGNAESESLKHPLGVRPSGNALTADGQNSALKALGAFSCLPDDMVVTLLEYLDQRALVDLGSTCRAMFAYCSYDQLWRDLAVQCSHDGEWRGSWRASLRALISSTLPRVDCRNVFSDALHRPFLCSQISMNPYARSVPPSKTIPRLSNLSTEQFDAQWTDRPFILTEPVKLWKVSSSWSFDGLAEQYANVSFRAEAVDWTMDKYLRYMKSTRDESPLYLFDRAFVEKMELEVGPDGDYEPPECFQEDLFTVLGDQRPDHRWLIIGPERSGSTFHKDPNATSAWNAVIRGSKYWIMFPPSVTPPGVFMSEDQSEVTSPLSIAEWLLTFHDEARNTAGCLEGVCQEGEVLHVPSGWWHLVVNLTPAIAITQNFVPKAHLRSVVGFLDRKRDQVSGFKNDVADPFRLFQERLRSRHPDLAAELEASAGTRKRKWDEVVAKAEDVHSAPSIGFSFGFEDDLDSDA
jgi:hypothetical protein